MKPHRELTAPKASPKLIDRIEETLMAFLLFAMTAITFANVVARYVFNSNILWALEGTVFLFAWLVLFGACYAFKHNIHIGIDILIERLTPQWQFYMAILASCVCIVFAGLLLVGSWNYWYPFATERAWFEVNDIPMPEFLRFIEPLFNEGEEYEKIPRFIPYAVLPLASALLFYRCCVAAWQICTKQRSSVIAAHGTEEDLETGRLKAKDSN